MNKTAIKNFAVWARNKLIDDIKYRAGLMGITESGVASSLPQSTGTTEFYDIGTVDPYAINGEAVRQRRRLVELIERKGKETDYKTAYKYIIEEVAYTWFNRLIAIRFMEVNDYLPSHIRVLSSESGKIEPDLVTTPFDADLEFSSEEEELVVQLKQDNQLDELFRILFIKQCNALNKILPALFEKTKDYTELLLNLSVIDQDGVVYHLVNDIPEENFDVDRGGQVEIIGWLYQYYNTEPKAAVDFLVKNGNKVKKEELPAKTQVFTPDWIVRYMVENSLGRIWIERHSDEELKSNWEYFIDEAEQEIDVQRQLDYIRSDYSDLEPKDIKVIDPCMGSGHVLVYAFDVLMQIYERVGYSQRDAAKNILENNLFGLDIDKRAFQMAYFAVLMKARQYNRRILYGDITLKLYVIQESNEINRQQLKYMGSSFNLNERNKMTIQLNDLLDNIKDAKEYGIILNIKDYDWEKLKCFIEDVEEIGQVSMDNVDLEDTKNQLLQILKVCKIMAQKYHIVVTNPPYMGASSMSANLTTFIKKNYQNSKADLFACCIEKGNRMLLKHGYNCMVTMQSWMFLGSFETMRKEAISTMNVTNLMHMENMVMGIAFGTAVTVFGNYHVAGYKGTYNQIKFKDIVSEKPYTFPVLGNRFAQICTDDFFQIPGAPIAYWASKSYIDSCTTGYTVSSLASPKTGMTTGDNNRFLRLWEEVSYDRLNVTAKSSDDAVNSGAKWFPYLKGGDFRRWYGNNNYVINWENNGYEIKNNIKPNGLKAASVRSENLYFKSLISWSAVSSGTFACRLNNGGALFDSGGSSLYVEKHRYYLLALLNSKVGQYALNLSNPTINYQPGDIASIPLKIDNEEEINLLVQQNIDISKIDWDSFETSWDFKRHPLARKCNSLKDAFSRWREECTNRFSVMKNNESRINEILIEAYGLSNELNPEVEDKNISVHRADFQKDIKSLLSYIVGCMFGRYSLDEDGVVFGGGAWEKYKYRKFIPDADNVIPITDEEYLEDDIISRMCTWLKIVFGEDSLEENIDFIAKALGNKSNSSRETIRNYFINEFYSDHCNTYSVTGSGKRPVYWLFDSGKNGGFKALIYMHRYNADTIGNIRVDYLHRMQHVYESEINRMQDIIDYSTDAREEVTATKRKEKLQKQLKECREYDEKIGHLALSRIELDLDDGVKINYEKVQTASDGNKYRVLAKI